MHKRIISWLLVVTLVLTLVQTPVMADPGQTANGIQMTPDSVPQSMQLVVQGTNTAQPIPASYTDGNGQVQQGLPNEAVVTSDDSSIVSITDEKKLMPVAAGNTFVRVKVEEAGGTRTFNIAVTVTSGDGYHTILFVVPDVGTQRLVVPTGTVPTPTISTARPSTAAETYAFTGWDKTIVQAAEDTTYTATYSATPRSYTIVFKNWDGSSMRSMNLVYGITPDVSGIRPTRPSTTNSSGRRTEYTFRGWSPNVSAVTGDATYTALFSSSTSYISNAELAKRTFTITFKNWDGEVLQKVKVQGGTKPEYTEEVPTRPIEKGYRYVFNGWDSDIETATSDATYKATFKRSTADKVVLTQKDISAAARNKLTAIQFPLGTLYITADGWKELQQVKSDVTITVTKESKKDYLTIKFLKGANETLITTDMKGISFLAEDMENGDIVELADDNYTSAYHFKPVILSFINQAGAYTSIPGSCSIREANNSLLFTDLHSDAAWCKSYVDFCAARGLVNGVMGSTFAPKSSITRAQAVVIAHRFMGTPQSLGGTAFDDVDPYEWYAQAVYWATAKNLMSGLASTQFSPNTGITRADQVLLLYKLAQNMGYPCSEREKLAKYRDAGLLKTGDQTAAMEWAVAAGIIEGTGASTLAPQEATNRGSFCAMMYRFIRYLTVLDDSEAVNYDTVIAHSTK